MTGPAVIPERTGRRLLLFGRLALTALLIWFVLSRIEPDQAAAAIGSTLPWGLLWVLVLLPVNLGLQWLRWFVLLRAGALPVSPRASLAMMFGGFSLGFPTPGRLGELGRGSLVHGEHDSISIAGLTVVERSLSFVGGVGVAIIAMIVGGYGNWWKWSLIVLTYGGALWLALHPPRVVELLRRTSPLLPSRFRERAAAGARRFVQGWHLAGRRATLTALLLSIVQVSVVLLQLTGAYHAVGTGAPLLKVLGAWAVVMGAKYFLPIAVGDIGVREGLAVLIFTDRNLPAAAAVGAALIIYLCNVLLPALVGTVTVAFGGRRGQRPSHSP
jgi:uncharacterized membrane protein YbhN (UPF0104 family)